MRGPKTFETIAAARLASSAEEGKAPPICGNADVRQGNFQVVDNLRAKSFRLFLGTECGGRRGPRNSTNGETSKRQTVEFSV